MGDWAHSRLGRIARADLDRMWNIYSAGETGGANEVMTELAALTDDPARHLQVRRGEYVAVSRRWSAGDRVDISMPLSFRTERAPDDPAVQSVFYDPTLMVSLGGAAPPIVWRGFGFYRHHTLDGDFSGAFTATATPMRFTSQGHVSAPFYVATRTRSRRTTRTSNGPSPRSCSAPRTAACRTGTAATAGGSSTWSGSTRRSPATASSLLRSRTFPGNGSAKGASPTRSGSRYWPLPSPHTAISNPDEYRSNRRPPAVRDR